MKAEVSTGESAGVLTGAQRRKHILKRIKTSPKPLSGTALGKETGVSRQVVVQDIALLRRDGYPILATARGYILNETMKAVRLFKVCHTADQIQEELETIVDLGGSVEDVMVNHRAYGKMSAPLRIRNRRDVSALLENLRTGKSTPLMNVTSGYHFHHVSADSYDILDEIEEGLRQKNLLAELFPYEQEEEEME